MTPRPALLVALLIAGGCSESGKRPAGQAARAPADAGAPAPGRVMTISVATGERLGAPAMERDVAVPVEEAVSRVPDVTRVRSVSGAQRVDVDVWMASGADPTAAMGAIQAAVTAAAPRLPAGVSPPEVRLRPARRIWLAVWSEAMSRDAIGLVGERIAEALARATGVRSVDRCGAGDPLVRVIVDPARLSALGVDLAGLPGQLGRAAAGVMTIEDLSAAVLATAPSGATIRVGDVATVERGASAPRCTAMAGARPALSIEVGLDSDEPEPLAREIDAIAASLPPGVHVERLTGAVLELHLYPPPGPDADGLRAIAGALASKIGTAPGGRGVIVESGDLRATPDSLAPPMRALVATSAPDAVIAAAESPDLGLHVAAGPGATAPILIQGDDLEPLHRAAETVAAAVAGTPGIAAASVAGAALAPRARIELDAPAIAAQGVQRADVAAAIALVEGGAHAGDLIEAGRRVPIRLEVAGASSADPAAIAGVLPSLRVRANKGLAPLSSLVKVTLAAEPLTILRHRRRRAVEVWFRPAPGTPADRAIAAARRAASAASLPAGIEIAPP